MNEDMNAEHGSVGTMNDTGKSVADAATVAVIMTLAKLYQVVIIHRSFKRGVNQITKGTLNDARKALEGLLQPAHTLRAVAQIAKVVWGTEDCCRLAVATLKKAIREHSNALLTLPTSDATGDDTPARELWRDITILDVAVLILRRTGPQRSWLARRGHWPRRSDRKLMSTPERTSKKPSRKRATTTDTTPQIGKNDIKHSALETWRKLDEVIQTELASVQKGEKEINVFDRHRHYQIHRSVDEHGDWL